MSSNLASAVVAASASKKANAAAVAMSGLRSEVHECREWLKTHKGRLVDAHNLRNPPDAAKKAVARWLDELAETAPDVSGFTVGTAGNWPSFSEFVPTGENGGRFMLKPQAVGLLVAALKPAIQKHLFEELDGIYEGVDYATPEQRAAIIKEIEREIRDVEIAEEAAIRAAERAGVTIARRADATVEIVIAADDALAAAA
jgi:hypothetical protein